MVFFVAVFRASHVCGASLVTLVSSVHAGLKALPNYALAQTVIRRCPAIQRGRRGVHR